MTEYAKRDIIFLDEIGDFYCKHISAMTGEGLHSKTDIAAELGYRDYRIELLSKALRSLSKSSKNISDSLKSGDHIPDFRYYNFEKHIKEAKN